MKTSFRFALVAAAAALCLSTTAFAQDDEPVSDGGGGGLTAPTGERIWANRSLVQPRGQLQILSGPTGVQAMSVPGFMSMGVGSFGIDIYRMGLRYSVDTGFGSVSFSGGSSFTSWPIGVSYAPIDNLEVGIGLPIQLSPGGFGNLPLWATYQFMDGGVQMGARLALYLPTQTGTGGFGNLFGIQAGLPVMLSLGTMRIDTGAFINVYIPTGEFSGDPTVSLEIPARIGFQITDALFAGAQTGIYIPGFDGVEIPLMGFVGYTLNPQFGPVDLGFRFGFDRAIWFGNALDQTGFARPNGPRAGGVDFNDFSIAIGADLAIQF